MTSDQNSKKNVVSPTEAAEVVNVAKMFDLDASNYSLVGSGGQAEMETVSEQIAIVPNKENESKPDLGKVVVTPQKNKFLVSQQPLAPSPIFRSRRRYREEEEESQSLLAVEKQQARRSIFQEEDYACLRNEDGERAGPSYAHVGPTVRGREQRAKLLGFDCPDCADYYRLKLEEGISKEQILMILNKCSRHRGFFKPPLTPEKFWDPEIIEGEPDDPRNNTQQASPDIRERVAARRERREKRAIKMLQYEN